MPSTVSIRSYLEEVAAFSTAWIMGIHSQFKKICVKYSRTSLRSKPPNFILVRPTRMPILARMPTVIDSKIKRNLHIIIVMRLIHFF